MEILNSIAKLCASYNFSDFLVYSSFIGLTLLTCGLFPYWISDDTDSGIEHTESFASQNWKLISSSILNKYHKVVNYFTVRDGFVGNKNLEFIVKINIILVTIVTFGLFLFLIEVPDNTPKQETQGMTQKRGKFIVLEGIDGSGKSTQVVNIVKTLFDINKNNQVLLTREPTWRSKEIRQNLESGNTDPQWLTKAFIKDRKLHVENEIEPALEKNVHVVCDRYYLSTMAYQGAQGVNMDELFEMHKDWIVKPDLTIVLDCPIEISSKRCQMTDQFDRDLEFQSVLRKTYQDLVARFSPTEKISVIDSNQPIEIVKDQILALVIDLFDKESK